MVTALVVGGCASFKKGVKGKTPREVDFVTEVKPVLEGRCLQCHNSEKPEEFAGLILETRELAMTTGRDAPVIMPGDPDGSMLYKVLTLGINHPVSMPPSPDKLGKDQIEAIHDWIANGAEWPDGEEGKLRMPE